MDLDHGIHSIAIPCDLPEWVQLLPAGTFRGRDGRGTHALSDPAVVVAATRAIDLDLPIDIDHQAEFAPIITVKITVTVHLLLPRHSCDQANGALFAPSSKHRQGTDGGVQTKSRSKIDVAKREGHAIQASRRPARPIAHARDPRFSLGGKRRRAGSSPAGRKRALRES